MGSSPSANLINPYSAAGSQYGYNVGAAEASQAGSNVNQVGPLGSTSFTQTGTGPGGVPTYTESTQLSPAEQELLGISQGVGAAGGTAAGKELGNFNTGNPVPYIGNMTSGLTGQMENAYLASVLPSQQTQLTQEETQLENQGITPGSPAWTNAIRPLVQGQQQANLGAAASFQPTAFGEATTLQGLPISEATSLNALINPQAPTAPSAAGLNIAPPNLLGATSAYNSAEIQQEQINNQFWQGLGGLGTSLLKLAGPTSAGGFGWISDRRLKRDIRQVDTLGGIPIYHYRRAGKWWFGPMSDDVRAIYPDCVDTSGPYEKVNFRMLVGNLALDVSLRELMDKRDKLEKFAHGPIDLGWVRDCGSLDKATDLLTGLAA